jgi:hypothetical protein
VLFAAGVWTQIHNVCTVNVVTAQQTWIDLERELAVGLPDGRLEAKRQIERRDSFGIKAAAVDGGAIPGKRLE